MKKSALFVAYHFPPVAVSSGVHRVVSLANAMSSNGWDVTVLSASVKTYERTDPETLDQVSPSIKISRSIAYDTARQLSIKGKYLQWMALPDNLQSWVFFGVIRGLKEIYKSRPNVLISTYPIASAHLIAIILNHITGIPWVCDFRDPMAQPGYPANPTKWKVFNWIEKQAAKRAARLVFATPGAMEEYKKRYPDVSKSTWLLITNGYNESQYQHIVPQIREDNIIQIVHSGLVYIHERNPRSLFEAISALKEDGFLRAENVQFIFRASGHEETYSEWLNELSVADIIKLEPQIPYKDALQEMFNADGLLLLQGDGCNQQIPAKAYEYLRAQRPVLALTDEAGDTALLLKENQVADIAPLDDVAAISDAIKNFIQRIQNKSHVELQLDHISCYSRQNIAEQWVKDIEALL